MRRKNGDVGEEFVQGSKAVYQAREYRIPGLEEAYQDDAARAMGYREAKKNYVYTRKNDKISE